jgi:hypothetical protein
MTDPVEEWAFRTLALAHPHEAYDVDPERFWQLFQAERPGVSKEQMLAILELTCGVKAERKTVKIEGRL